MARLLFFEQETGPLILMATRRCDVAMVVVQRTDLQGGLWKRLFVIDVFYTAPIVKVDDEPIRIHEPLVRPRFL
jgi:hypothetical protein